MDNPINAEISHILNGMSELEVGSEEYNLAAQSLKILCEARSKRPSFPIEPEAIVGALVNVLGIMLIIRHEEFNHVATRAIGFVRRY